MIERNCQGENERAVSTWAAVDGEGKGDGEENADGED